MPIRPGDRVTSITGRGHYEVLGSRGNVVQVAPVTDGRTGEAFWVARLAIQKEEME